MDGLSKTNDVVFVLAASNLPWELDAAMLRRLEKRVLVDLPSAEAREKLFSSLLEPYIPSNFNFDEAVKRTEVPPPIYCSRCVDDWLNHGVCVCVKRDTRVQISSSWRKRRVWHRYDG